MREYGLEFRSESAPRPDDDMTSPDPGTTDAWQPDYRPATIERALTAAMCERTIAIAHEVGFAKSPVYSDLGPEENSSFRKSDSAYLNPEHFRELYGIVPQIVRQSLIGKGQCF